MTPQGIQASALKSSVEAAQATVVFATPSLSNHHSVEYERSMLETVQLLRQQRHRPAFIERNGDQFIANARNKLVADFLLKYPSAENVFFLDDDIGWEPCKVIEFLDRPEHVVAGVYPKKSHILDFPVDLCVDLENGGLIERDGLVKALVVPFGFVRIRRLVLYKMAMHSRVFTEQEPDGSIGTFYNIFESGVFDGSASKNGDGYVEMSRTEGELRFWGEDYVFCRKLAEFGIDIWVDPDCELTHRGPMCWKATLAHHMQHYRDQASRIVAAAE